MTRFGACVNTIVRKPLVKEADSADETSWLFVCKAKFSCIRDNRRRTELVPVRELEINTEPHEIPWPLL